MEYTSWHLRLSEQRLYLNMAWENEHHCDSHAPINELLSVGLTLFEGGSVFATLSDADWTKPAPPILSLRIQDTTVHLLGVKFTCFKFVLNI